MKPIRDYNDGQWLLLLWAFIVVFLVTGSRSAQPVLVVAILAALAAAYTTYLYLRERIGRSPTGSVFGRTTPTRGEPDRRAPDRTTPTATNAAPQSPAPARDRAPSPARPRTPTATKEAPRDHRRRHRLGSRDRPRDPRRARHRLEDVLRLRRPRSARSRTRSPARSASALPGSLPVVNERAIEFAVRIGLALNCDIASWCRFARKNYFYPDMPKNYQISQYDEPLCAFGHLDVEVDGEIHRVGITRVHLEEDTGKSLHVGGSTGRIHGATHSLLDYNRAGVPLVEIVTEPDIRSAARRPAPTWPSCGDLLRSLGVSEARMEQGQMRCDANVSLRPRGDRRVRHADRDEEPQLAALRRAGRRVRDRAAGRGARGTASAIVQETRHFDEAVGPQLVGRVKEEATDYRYFPEPDLTPMALARDYVEAIRATLPELPAQRRARLLERVRLHARSTSSRCAAPGVLDLVQDTIVAGASPEAAKSWWLNEPCARRPTPSRAADPRRRRRPHHRAGRRGRAHQRARPAGDRGGPRRRGHVRTRWSSAAGSPWSATTTRWQGRRRRDRRGAGHRGEGPRRQAQRRRSAGRRRHEGDAGQGRRQAGARAAAGAPRSRLTSSQRRAG